MPTWKKILLEGDAIPAENVAAGAFPGNAYGFPGSISVGTISEAAEGAGVSVDGVLLKDGGARLPNAGAISARNAADTADVGVIKLNASDKVEFGALLAREGVADGLATLGSDGKVPSAQLPSLGTGDHGALTGLADDDHTQYELRSEKGVANGYASLGADGLVPTSQLPMSEWADWTPSVAQGVSVSVNVLEAKYSLVGKTLHWYCRLSVTGSGTSGQAIRLSGFPVAPAEPQYSLCGFMKASDVSGPTHYTGISYFESLSPLRTQTTRDGAGEIGSSPAWGLASGDVIQARGFYRVA
mgnify:CR=1 FL=1